ncbi:MAG: hypothetical protein OEY33_06845 [Bdellovibrionales bacterium]|nr:hypothetical protein [Bdellovibrionales bacterium]
MKGDSITFTYKDGKSVLKATNEAFDPNSAKLSNEDKKANISEYVMGSNKAESVYYKVKGKTFKAIALEGDLSWPSFVP